MRKHLSVLMLFIRGTMCKALLIVLAMAAAESVLFALNLRGAGEFFGLDTVLRNLGNVYAVCFLVMCALLCLYGCDFGSKQSNTLMRLRVSRRAVFIWQSANNAGFLLLFWAAQIGIALIFCGIYTARYNQPQAAMLAFYTNRFLHNMLPLADRSRYIYNIALLVSLALTTACFPLKLSRSQKPLAAFLAVGFCLQSFAQKMGDPVYNFAFTAIILFCAYIAVRGVWKEVPDETDF